MKLYRRDSIGKPGQPADINSAITILSAGNVVTVQKISEVFNHASLTSQITDEIDTTVRYTEESLRECANLNRLGDTDWRLVYGLPLSLRQQREIIGTEPKSQTCFFYEIDWWLGEAENSWANSKPVAGYYLIDFKGRFNKHPTNWENQGLRISRMGGAYTRADERVYLQALISMFKPGGKRLYAYHWGRIKDSKGYRVSVGIFGSGGLLVGNENPESFNGLDACVALKFQF